MNMTNKIEFTKEATDQIEKIVLKQGSDIYNANTQIVCFSDKMNEFDLAIKDFLKEKMYYSKEVLKKTVKGKKIIKKLFFIINRNPRKYLKKEISINKNKTRNICDFIASMTDRYAINIYNLIK